MWRLASWGRGRHWGEKGAEGATESSSADGGENIASQTYGLLGRGAKVLTGLKLQETKT